MGELAAGGHGVDADDSCAVDLEQLGGQVADEAESEDDDPVVDVVVSDLGGGDGDHAHADGGGEVAGDVVRHGNDDGVGIVDGDDVVGDVLALGEDAVTNGQDSTSEPSSITRPQLA